MHQKYVLYALAGYKIAAAEVFLYLDGFLSAGSKRYMASFLLAMYLPADAASLFNVEDLGQF